MAVRLLGNGLEAIRTTRTMSLGEGESLRFRRRDGACVATVIHDGRLAVELASRMPPRLPPQNGGRRRRNSRRPGNKTALRMPGNALPAASGAGDDSSLAAASTQDGPFDAARPETQIGIAGFTLSARGAALQAGRSRTRQVRVATAIRRTPVCDFAHAPQWQGHSIARRSRFDGTVGQISAVTLRDGFLGGNGVNVLEFDVRARSPGRSCPGT